MKSLSIILFALCSCASAGTTIHYQLIERTRMADVTLVEVKSVLTCHALSRVDSDYLMEKCKARCYEAAESVTAREKAEDKRDGNKIMSVAHVRMICHKL